MNFSEESLVLAVDLIFKKYDINEDGEIDADELFYMLEDAHAKMGLKNKPTNEQVQVFLTNIKCSKENSITYDDFYRVLKDIYSQNA